MKEKSGHIRLLLVFDFPLENIGGIETHVKHLIEGLKTRPNIFYGVLVGSYMKSLNLAGKSIVLPKRISSAIRGFRPDVIHVHGFASIFVMQTIKEASFLGVKTVYTPHYHPISSLKRPFFAKLFFKFFLKPALRAVDSLIVLTNEEKVFFQPFLRLDAQIDTIPNGVILPKSEKPSVRERAILFVGRNVHNKRLDFILAQESFFLKHQIKVYIVTTDNFTDRGPFSFRCKVSDTELDQLFRKIKVAVVPSKYEAFSLVALEALARGASVIVSDAVMIKEYFEGISRFSVFEYNNVAAFQDLLLSQLVFEASTDDDQILNQRLEEFSWDNVAEKTIGIYEK
jgi:glycosyltransferase involved in cell wall biosynthesis